MLILSGQGNPTDRYAKNRHNAGFIVLDALHARHNFGPWRSKFESLIAEGTVGGQKVLLVKPQTYYNETGRALSKVLQFYKRPADDVTVFYDEIDLAPGRLRVKRGGGHSGNNGVRSMMAHLGKTSAACASGSAIRATRPWSCRTCCRTSPRRTSNGSSHWSTRSAAPCPSCWMGMTSASRPK